MKKQVQIRQSDKHRSLLTELLPYETPIIFSNLLLYSFAHAVDAKMYAVPTLVAQTFRPERNRASVAYEYKIRQGQGQGQLRTLSLVHPATQVRFSSFYEKHHELILSLCKKSSYSLRYPVRVASYFYRHELDSTGELRTEEVDELPDAGADSKFASSYFYYSKFNQLYKFVESAEFLECERRFTRLRKFDIKRCFASIYTHSIEWAVKGKRFAKINRGKEGFASGFDELMRACNYDETNGIVIGPEISRIFAEIILQQVDLNIETVIAEKGIPRSDYDVRRYLDDYYLFTRSEAVEAAVLEVVEDQLKEFKMYINEAKTKQFQIPFATSQTIAKSDVKAILKGSVLDWLNTVLRNEDEGVGAGVNRAVLSRPLKAAHDVIRDVKIALKRSDEQYAIVTGYALSAIVKACFRLDRRVAKKQPVSEDISKLQSVLIATIEVIFHLYAMDFRVRTTYLIAQFIIIVKRIASLDERVKADLDRRLYRSVVELLESRPTSDLGGIEMQNLVIASHAIDPISERLTENQLVRFLGVESKRSKREELSYFDMMSVLYVIEAHAGFDRLRAEIIGELKSRFLNLDSGAALDSEVAHLLADSCACPYISQADKYDLIDAFSVRALQSTLNQAEKNQVINFFRDKLHFIDWSKQISFEKHLVRRQLTPGY